MQGRLWNKTNKEDASEAEIVGIGMPATAGEQSYRSARGEQKGLKLHLPQMSSLIFCAGISTVRARKENRRR